MENQRTKNTNEVGRRVFLKVAGLTSLCGVALPTGAAKASGEPEENDLASLIARLEESEKQALQGLLQKLEEMGYMFTPHLAAGALWFLDMAIKGEATRKKTEKAKKQERGHIRSLSQQERLDYFVKKLEKEFSIYSPSYQRGMLERAVNGEQSQPDWKTTHDTDVYYIGKTYDCLDGCSKSFCQKVITQYLNEVLPPLEAEQKKEDAHEAAVDEFLDLVSDKSTGQIATMTAQIKAMAV